MGRIELYVDDGRVPCPRRQHDVEVDTCLACERLDDVRWSPSGATAVTCRRPWTAAVVAEWVLPERGKGGPSSR